ncbi:MAG: amidohydrolase family protein [Acidimicrobiia bacterium]|nr:amidohydrolase family protein [Acidimicrobiia bacterium]
MSRSSYPTRFESTLELDRLPWFEVRGGNRLVLTDDARAEVGPIIDMHTHLAMAFFRRNRIDLHAATPTVAYYLPVTLPVDLDRYSNLNLDASAMFAMKADVSVLGLTAQGMRTTHTAPNLVRDMEALGIVSSVVLPIDLPLGARNADDLLEVARRYPELLPFGSVHPYDRDLEQRLDRQQRDGALGIKLHPNGQFIAPDHPKTVHLCGRCGQRGLPVLFHCGPVGIEPAAARRRSQVDRYERTIAENPDTTFVLGHSGALQHHKAIAFADRYPNTLFELSCLGLEAMREVLDVVPGDRLLYGTDWPFYHQALTLARVLIATEDDAGLRRSILHDNAARLLADRSVPAGRSHDVG